MALNPNLIEQHKAKVKLFIPRETQCGCGCLTIYPYRDEWLHCNNGVFYVDEYCVVAHMAEESGGKVLWLGHELSIHEFVYNVMEAKPHDYYLKRVSA